MKNYHIKEALEKQIANQQNEAETSKAEGVNCPRCNEPNPANGLYCFKCGAKLRESSRTQLAPQTKDNAVSDASLGQILAQMQTQRALSVGDGWRFGIGFGLALAIAVPIIFTVLSCFLGRIVLFGGSAIVNMLESLRF